MGWIMLHRVTGPRGNIKANIEDRILWDPRVEHDLLDISVTPDGVVTLSGTVNAWIALRAAEDDARRGGATRVVDKLTLGKQSEAGAP
jgi:osmotically-inducible protein OsmY